jgi:hypothetical protein
MWLIACNPGDAAALWAARRLADHGLEPLEVVSAEALAYAPSIEHRLGNGAPSVRIELADGRRVASEEFSGMLNRLTHPPMDHLGVAQQQEREYAMQEVPALFLSWLAAMPGPVLNRPVPFGLAGPNLDQLQWLALAARAGLRTPTHRATSRRRNGAGPASGPAPGGEVVVACGALYGAPLPVPTAESCLRLAELSGTDILGIGLRRDTSGRLEFAAARPLPDLRIGGEPLIDGLATALVRGAEA